MLCGIWNISAQQPSDTPLGIACASVAHLSNGVLFWKVSSKVLTLSFGPVSALISQLRALNHDLTSLIRVSPFMQLDVGETLADEDEDMGQPKIRNVAATHHVQIHCHHLSPS